MNNPGNTIPFAVMINGRHFKQWQSEAVKSLCDSGLCSCVLFISQPDEITPKKSFLKRVFKKNLLYTYLLNRLFKVPAEQVCEIPGQIPVIDVPVTNKGFSQYVSDADIQRITSYKPQFIIRFGYNILRGSILNCTPYGVWSYHHGDERKFRGGPFGFWEIRKHEPTTGVILQKLTDKLDAGQVLIRREYITVFHSLKEMRQCLLAENTDMPVLAVKKYIIHQQNLPVSSETNAKIYKNPGNFVAAIFTIRLFFHRVVFHFRRLMIYERWHVESGRLYSSPLVPVLPSLVKSEASRRNAFHADPFLFKSGNDYQLFCEQFSYADKIGQIVKVSNNQKASVWITNPYHMAYPYVFTHSGKTWVIPENAESGKCTAYQIDNQLNVVSQTVLISMPLVDPSVVFHEGRFYLFCGLLGDRPNEKLYIFWSESFEGPWYPHEGNPVKVSPDGSRPGGTLFLWQNNLHRPAQVSRLYYGEKVKIYRILELSPHSFDEVLVSEISPRDFGDQYHGLHTYSQYENRYAVDLKVHRFGLTAFAFRWKSNRKSRRQHD